MFSSVLTEHAGITLNAPAKSKEVSHPLHNTSLSLDPWNFPKSYGIGNIQEKKNVGEKKYLVVAVAELVHGPEYHNKIKLKFSSKGVIKAIFKYTMCVHMYKCI